MVGQPPACRFGDDRKRSSVLGLTTTDLPTLKSGAVIARRTARIRFLELQRLRQEEGAGCLSESLHREPMKAQQHVMENAVLLVSDNAADQENKPTEPRNNEQNASEIRPKAKCSLREDPKGVSSGFVPATASWSPGPPTRFLPRVRRRAAEKIRRDPRQGGSTEQ